jgi:hypothetical protein
MTDTDNIIPMPTPLAVLADRIRSAHGRTERGRQEWIEGTLELAAALAEARARFTSDQKFSHWIVDATLEDISHQDRAALIRMAGDLAATRQVLEETQRNSWRLVWEKEIEPRFTNAGNPVIEPPNAANPPSIPASAPQVASEIASPPPPVKPLSKRSPFYGKKRANDVAAVYLSVDARADIGRVVNAPGGKEVWSLILTAIDAGFLTPTETEFTSATLCILFPRGDRTYCRRFNLANAKDRQQVIARIMPAALANQDAVLAAPGQLEQIVAAYWQRRQDVAREAAARERVSAALQAMPADQREVFMFDTRLWPRVDPQHGEYDYDQLCAACWYFVDLDAWLSGSISGKSPGSRAIITRLSTRWMQEYIDRSYSVEARGKIKKVYQIVQLIAGLLERNPEGRCVVPPTPKIEGQWS